MVYSLWSNFSVYRVGERSGVISCIVLEVIDTTFMMNMIANTLAMKITFKWTRDKQEYETLEFVKS